MLSCIPFFDNVQLIGSKNLLTMQIGPVFDNFNNKKLCNMVNNMILYMHVICCKLYLPYFLFLLNSLIYMVLFAFRINRC